MTAKIGDRVLSHVGSGGSMLPGTVEAVMTVTGQPVQYMVRFDGNTGHSGPCFYVEPLPS